MFALSFGLAQPPFVGGNRDKIQQKIVKDKIKLPSFLTSEAHTLLKGVNFKPIFYLCLKQCFSIGLEFFFLVCTKIKEMNEIK